MSERYTRIFTLPANLQTEDAPITITSGRLLYDNEKDRKVVVLKFKNVSDKEIQSVIVSIKPFNSKGAELDTIPQYTYANLQALSNAEFGNKKAIPVASRTAASFDVEVESVLFGDGSSWSCPKGAKWAPSSRIEEVSVEHSAVQKGSVSAAPVKSDIKKESRPTEMRRSTSNYSHKSASKRKKKSGKAFAISAAIVLVVGVAVFFGSRLLDFNIANFNQNASDIKTDFKQTASDLEKEEAQKFSKNESWEYTVYETYVELEKYIGEKTAEVSIPAAIENLPVKILNLSAFQVYLTDVPYSIVSIKENAWLEKVIIPESIILINTSMTLHDVSNLSEVEFTGSQYIEFGEDAFHGTSLTSEAVNEILLHTTSVPQGMFEDCHALEYVSIPNNIETIGLSAFSGCYNLVEVDLGYVKEIDPPFYDCNKLSKVTVRNDNLKPIIEEMGLDFGFESSDTVLYCNEGSTAAKYAAANQIIMQPINTQADADKTAEASESGSPTFEQLKQLYLETAPIYVVKANVQEYTIDNLIDVVYKNVSNKHGIDFKYYVIPYDSDFVPLKEADWGTDDATIKSGKTGGGDDGGIYIPRETKNVVAIVSEIEFTDGSTWEFEYIDELIEGYERDIESNDPLLIPLTFVY